LLSLSWSPPLFCGIPLDSPEPDADSWAGAAAFVAGGVEEELEELEEPHPASASATSTANPPASLRAVNLLVVIVTSVVMVART
jgi:hypothetical protein